MPEGSPLFWPVSELVTAYAAAELSPVEVTDEALKRIGSIDAELHAYLTVTDEFARAQAQEAERRYAGLDETPGLLGVPAAIKDLFRLQGAPTSLGSLIYRDEVAQEDSPVVARLKAGGAVTVGKTNTAEFGQSATTENMLGPGCGNPWNPKLTAGGSSGGAASAVSAGLAAVALGSDGGGSIRIPAAMCGLFGIKPTVGSVPDDDSFRAMTDFGCAGPLVRRVADARPFLAAMLRRNFARGAARTRRIAWCPAPEGRPVARGVAKAVAAAVHAAAELGHEVEQVDLPIEDWQDAFGPLVLADEWRYRRHLLDDRPELLTDYARRSIEAAAELADADVERARAVKDELRARVAGLFERFDFIVTPATATTAFPIGERPDRIDGTEVDTLWGPFPFTAPFNVAGSPAASLPCGLAGGLPVGLQVVGPHGAEGEILDFCQQLEEALEFPVNAMAERWTDPVQASAVPEPVAMEVKGDVATIRIDREAKRNALSRAMLEQVRSDAVDAVDAGAAAIVLTGGNRFFSAGIDLGEVGSGETDLGVDVDVADAVEALRGAAVPVIAAVEGPCVGAAVELALACDVRVAGEDAFFQLPATRLGLLYRPDGLVDLVTSVGRQTASRLLLLGDRVEADDALACGLVARVVPAGEALDAALALARLASQASPAATRATKQLIIAAERGDPDLTQWEATRRRLLVSHERREAVRAARQQVGAVRDG